MAEDLLNCESLLDFNVIKSEKNFILVHKDLPRFLFTNSTGIDILRTYEKSGKLESVIRLLREKYGISSEQAKKDVKKYLDRFLRVGPKSNDYQKPVPAGNFKPKIKRLNINLVSGCNLNCLHCGVPFEPGKIKRWDKKCLEKIIAGFLDSEEKSVVFTGGEPMLHPAWLEILELSQAYGRTILASNCTLLKKAEIEKLSKMNVILQISLESHLEKINDKIRGKGNFKKVKEIIKQLVDAGMGNKIAICTTLTKYNAHMIGEMIEFTKSLGINSFRLLPLQKLHSAVQHWEILGPEESELDVAYSDFYKRILQPDVGINLQGGIPGLYLNFGDKAMWCQVGTIVNLDEDQNVYPCSLLMHDEFYLGNLKSDSLEKIQNSERFKKIILDCYNRKNLIQKCSKCAIKSICQGGCPGTVWNEHGNIFMPDDLCSLRAKHFLNLMTYLHQQSTNDPT